MNTYQGKGKHLIADSIQKCQQHQNTPCKKTNRYSQPKGIRSITYQAESESQPM